MGGDEMDAHGALHQRLSQRLNQLRSYAARACGLPS